MAADKSFAIYSCNGFAREVLPSLRKMIGGHADIVFVEDDESFVGETVHGIPVISFDELCKTSNANRLVSVAVANGMVREKLVERCANEGFRFADIRDRSSLQHENVVVEEGAILCANTMLTGDSTIGRHFHCNIYSYVAHDCIIGDFVTFGPRVCCNGRVVIGDRAYIGTGAMLKQGSHDKPLRIGKDAIVGMGAVVLKDVADGDVVAGNPAKIIRNVYD